ncbi:MAG: endolytic transglycosylase MltG, partial [Patescibacteria group bacterium]
MLNILHKISEKLSFKPSKKVLMIIVTGIFSALGLFYYFFVAPPVDFPANSIYSIEERSTLSEIAVKAKKQNLIKSPLIFKILAVLSSGNKGVISGDYVLNKKENIFEIAKRFANGDYRLSAVKVTVPEGFNIYEIAELLSKEDDLRNFNQQEFLQLAKGKEGYLYPDTYFFLPNIKAKQIMETMEENFTEKIAPIQKDIKKFGKTFEEVLTMASILEKEVPKTEDRKIVAGILWKRIKIGIP